MELRDGMPEAWNWQVFEFVESCFDRFSDLVIQELELLRDFWQPCKGSGERYGAFAGMKASERLRDLGLAVYSPGPSQQQEPPFGDTGPRWYVSVTPLAMQLFGESLPLPPDHLRELLMGHPSDGNRPLRARGLGWTLAPSGSDPQALHADIWGNGAHERTDRTRWPHILWKRNHSEMCTTEVVPGAFTQGAYQDCHFQQIRRARAPVIVVDSEALHRGAATAPATAAPASFGARPGWVSTLSLELCTASGWDAWEDYATGGTTKDPSSPLDWRMLVFGGEPGIAAVPVPDGLGLRLGAASLSPAPWASEEGKARLMTEQREWEFQA